MNRSFRCPDTERLAQGWALPRFQWFARAARRKLRQLEIASQHSIRINDPFRLCFIWTAAGPDAVEIVDYH
jgi:proteic killer suppression protein